jgi:hypothetical protein
MGSSNKRNWARRALFALGPALAFHPAPAVADVCQYQNLMPEFFAFEAATKNLAPDIRAERFAKEFAAKHPAFYGDKDLGWPARVQKDSLGLLDPRQAESLPGFPPLTEARLHAVARTVTNDFAAAQDKFLKAFPDFRCQDSVEFGPSFRRFDGHEYKDAAGHGHMLFGIDAIAMLHGPEDMPAFFTHELFHIYHRQVMGARLPDPEGIPWWVMWEEGLATYVSQRLNPTLDAQQVLWFPQDIVQRMQAPGATVRAARLMLADFDKVGGGVHWFSSGDPAPGGLPPRAGYYMGYLLASELGRDHPLGWLAQLPPDQVKQRARAFLEARAKAK